MKKRIILTIGVIGVICYFIGLYTDNYILRMVSKPFPLLALISLLSPKSKFQKFVFAGLIFSLMGDMFLESSPNMFVFGLLAFLTGHIMYIIAFAGRNKQLAILPLIFVLIYGIGIYWYLYPNLNEMVIPVLAYVIVILIMVWRAIAQRKADKFAFFAIFGSILFVFSDSIIAINKFNVAVPYARWIIMTAYWTSQSLIFYAAYKSIK